MNKETIAILTNREVVAIDQDSLGVQGLRCLAEGDLEVWAKPLMSGDWAICFLNRSLQPRKLHFDWSKHQIADNLSGNTLSTHEAAYRMRDLWAKKNLGTTQQPFIAEIPAHDVVLLRLTKQ